MTDSSISPNLLYLATTGWKYIQDVYWLLTAEGAKETTHNQIEHLKEETITIATTPAKQNKVPILPSDVEPTLEKIDNIMHFIIPTCDYLGYFCFYAAAGCYAWHVSTRFFTTISLTFFAAAVFFATLWSDFRELKNTAMILQRDFDLIMGKKGSLKKLHVTTRIDLTKTNIRNSIFHVTQLSKSLFIMKYLLSPAINQTKSHLRGLNQRIISATDDP